MQEIDGKWTLFGCADDDARCLHTVVEAVQYIKTVGFLPFFSCDIPGFSLEERTVSANWWTGDVSRDPWEWRAVIAAEGDIAYGKFFGGRTGFISKEWLPYFVNYRRDGYDFDALWDDEKASLKAKKVMDVFNGSDEVMSNELKVRAGFGKDGEKGFEGVVTKLQMQTYLCVRDFRQRRNRKGEQYGWAIAVYSTPEYIFGRELVTSGYSESPERSAERIEEHICRMFPGTSKESARKLFKRA